jgi:hypothetical protein
MSRGTIVVPRSVAVPKHRRQVRVASPRRPPLRGAALGAPLGDRTRPRADLPGPDRGAESENASALGSYKLTATNPIVDRRAILCSGGTDFNGSVGLPRSVPDGGGELLPPSSSPWRTARAIPAGANARRKRPVVPELALLFTRATKSRPYRSAHPFACSGVPRRIHLIRQRPDRSSAKSGPPPNRPK